PDDPGLIPGNGANVTHKGPRSLPPDEPKFGYPLVISSRNGLGVYLQGTPMLKSNDSLPSGYLQVLFVGRFPRLSGELLGAVLTTPHTLQLPYNRSKLISYSCKTCKSAFTELIGRLLSQQLG
ncbi:hypothetical protein PIB30_098963, partial [Stylosanthes scabra]|nr:hypothetical protein [Stylosanthes scabra]